MINTIIIQSGDRKIELSLSSRFMLNRIKGISENIVNVGETQFIGQVGANITSMTVQPRNITIDGTIMNDLTNSRRIILDTFIPLKEIKILTNINNQAHFVNAVVKTSPVIENSLTTQKFQVVLYCAYPYWQSVDGQVVKFANLFPMFQLPHTIGPVQLSRYDQEVIKTLVNNGNAPIGLKAIFKASGGNVTAPKLLKINNTTRLATKNNFILRSGETLEISTLQGDKYAKLYKGGVIENAFKYVTIDTDFNMEIESGDNLFKYEADNNVEVLTVDIVAPQGVLYGI